MNGSTHLINFFLTKTIDDVPDDDGEHYLVLPMPPGHRVADQTHPNPPDEVLKLLWQLDSLTAYLPMELPTPMLENSQLALRGSMPLDIACSWHEEFIEDYVMHYYEVLLQWNQRQCMLQDNGGSS